MFGLSFREIGEIFGTYVCPGMFALVALALVLAFVRRLIVGTRRCPYCRERIQPDAILCKHCHKDLRPMG